jgi:hypothetical protein
MQQLRPEWLPQLQWHCLAAGTRSALLLSRNPSKGVTVFRVHRRGLCGFRVCSSTCEHVGYSWRFIRREAPQCVGCPNQENSREHHACACVHIHAGMMTG